MWLYKLVDTFGHQVGDKVLVAAAEAAKSALRPEDMVSRIGGDEFVVLLPDIIGIEGALSVAEKIHASIRNPIIDGEQGYQVGTSVGISLYPAHGQSPDELLQHADHAMYHGKSRGGCSTRVYDSAA